MMVWKLENVIFAVFAFILLLIEAHNTKDCNEG